MKVYRREGPHGTLDNRNIVQRGVRGIHLGFPSNQAGWVIFIPSSRHVLSSADVSFDESFASASSFNEQMFHDASPVRRLNQPFQNNGESTAHTGPPLFTEEDVSIDAPWTPYTRWEPEISPDTLYEDEANALDTFVSTPEAINGETPEEEERGIPISDNPIQQENNQRDILFPNGDNVVLRNCKRVDRNWQAMVRHYLQMKIIEANAPSPPPSNESGEEIEKEAPFDTNASSMHSTPEDFEGINESRESMDTEDSVGTETDEPQLRRSARVQKRFQGFAMHVARIMCNNKIKAPTVPRRVANAFNATMEILGEPDTDPSPFLPEPRTFRDALRCPLEVMRAWFKAVVKELKGLIIGNRCFKMEMPREGEQVAPLWLVFKAKIGMMGLLDKLKVRAVFRGDLYQDDNDIDPWNPHASWVSLRIFLAMCAMRGFHPCQIDFVMAYVQARMRKRAFVEIPQEWAQALPEDLRVWCGRPLLCLKALYGYTFSGKFLYEDQAEFLRDVVGMRQTSLVGLWVKNLSNGKILLVLQYSDDFLAGSDDDEAMNDFKSKISNRFDVEVKPRADWFLQARIRQDSEGNTYLDQQRYSKAIVARHLPNVTGDPTPREMKKYRSPLPRDFKWTKTDNSVSKEDVRNLESECGFRHIEVAGSLNYLANAAIEELFAIRKACRHVNLPGRNHFRAIVHLLHHLRCHPTNAICYYKKLEDAPLTVMLKQLDVDARHSPLLWMADASHGDCDEWRSACACMGFLQGGVIDMNSFVPAPVAGSTGESETMAISAGSMVSSYVKKGTADILFGDETRLWTIPFLTDSQAGMAMNNSDKPTSKNRHIERRYFYGRSERKNGNVWFSYIDTNHCCPDIATKNMTAEESSYKLSLVEVPVTDTSIGLSRSNYRD